MDRVWPWRDGAERFGPSSPRNGAGAFTGREAASQEPQTEASASTPAAADQAKAANGAMLPYNVDVPEEELAELRRRIAATRWPQNFAAWEEPELFATEIRAAFRSLR